LLLALSIGCAEQVPPPATNVATAPTDSAKVIAVVAKVSIFDERSGVADPERSLYMPQTGIVGKSFDLIPALSDGDLQLIERETLTYFVPGERTVELDIYITSGKQSFAIGEMKETLSLEFAVRIEMANQSNVIDVVTALGEASLNREAVHLDRDGVPDLYARVIRESLQVGFKTIIEDAQDEKR